MSGTPTLEEAQAEITRLRQALQSLTDRHANLLAELLQRAVGGNWTADVEHLPAIAFARMLLADTSPGDDP